MKPVSKFCLIGIPDHHAVFAVGGRIGAARGPVAFDAAFNRLKGKTAMSDYCLQRESVGGITRDVAANHRLAADRVKSAHQSALLSVVVGGSHDHGYSQLLGIREALIETSGAGGARIGCINIDAHLDVRKPSPLITSGSPFYLALENQVIQPQDFIEFGIQSHCNSPELWDYVQAKKIQVVPFDELRNGKALPRFSEALRILSKDCDAVVISLDLDAAAEAFAPGVSAPQSEGFSSSEMIQMSEISGADGKVRSLGLFELNPEHDIESKTARLAATCAYHFIETSLKAGCLSSG